ncbi:MAG: trypsin-like peptidase domain-containing protein [Verrucomicrobiota bacterium]|nr:trypsin-like peptidase domain-containing protein [Verrucomicrobiota bacterium]
MMRPTPALFFGLTLLTPLAVRAEEPPRNPGGITLLRALDQGFVEVFEKVAPSVVVITAVKRGNADEELDLRGFESFLRDGEGRPRNAPKEQLRLPPPSLSEGSGFIIRPEGYILTNHHVILGAEKIQVRLKDGRRFAAKVVGADDRTDIAVLKIEAPNLPVATLGDSEALRVGQLVCAIGAPFNQEYSFTCGWVSGKGRTNLLGPTSPTTLLYEDYIQTDAFINPGNSGGPLFDVDGSVIGMNTLINGLGRGLAFAIPANMLREVGDQLIAGGRVQRSWIGVRIVTLGDDPTREPVPGEDQGVWVDTIEANSPAYRSDLRPADVITEVDGVKLIASKDLQKQILRKKVGQVVQLTVSRGGKVLTIPVTTGELPAEFTRVAMRPARKAAEPPETAFGLKLRDGDPAGAVVLEVAPDSPAAKANLQAEDLITDVASKPVSDANSALGAIRALRPENRQKGVLLNIERKGQRTHAVLQLKE